MKRIHEHALQKYLESVEEHFCDGFIDYYDFEEKTNFNAPPLSYSESKFNMKKSFDFASLLGERSPFCASVLPKREHKH